MQLQNRDRAACTVVQIEKSLVPKVAAPIQVREVHENTTSIVQKVATLRLTTQNAQRRVVPSALTPRFFQQPVETGGCSVSPVCEAAQQISLDLSGGGQESMALPLCEAIVSL